MGELTQYLKAKEAAWNSKTPLERPVILDDPRAEPVKRAEAERVYAEALLGRRTLTQAEQVFLGAQISRCLKGE